MPVGRCIAPSVDRHSAYPDLSRVYGARHLVALKLITKLAAEMLHDVAIPGGSELICLAQKLFYLNLTVRNGCKT